MKRLFIAGLIILLPIAFTYWVAIFFIGIVTGPFVELAQDILSNIPFLANGFWIFSEPQLLSFLSKFFILIFLMGLLCLVGYVGRLVFFRTLLYFGDRLLRKIPFVRKIYSACKDFTEALFTPKSGSFSQVVLVPFPARGQLGMGLVTSEFSSSLLQKEKKEYVSVLLPGTPNPTIGFVLIFDKKDVIYIDLKPDEALKYLISAGSSTPKKGFGRMNPPLTISPNT